MSTFIPGPGVKQGAVVGDQDHKTEHDALIANEPEVDGASDFHRPWPTDPGGDNSAGWMKTLDYSDGYYGGDSGPFKQV